MDIRKKLSSIRTSSRCARLNPCEKYTKALQNRFVGLIVQQDEICDGAIESIIKEVTDRNCRDCDSSIKNV